MLSVNKQAIATAFGRAATSYSCYDTLQRQSALGLRMLLGASHFSNVLDAGCGPGRNGCAWRASGSLVTALDLSLNMIIQARERGIADTYLVGDIEALPLLNSCFDLVWSHLAVQWCESLDRALNELYRVARKGGLVAFTTLLDQSMIELRKAWKAVDAYSHTNYFLSKKEVISVISSWRYRYVIENITLKFDDVFSAMQSLKGIGATHLHNGRPRKAFTRGDLQRLALAWPQHQEQFPLTYQLFHGIIERD